MKGCLVLIGIIGVVVLIAYISVENQRTEHMAKEKAYSFNQKKRRISDKTSVSERTQYIKKDDYYETTYENGKQVTRRKNDSYTDQLGYDLVVTLSNDMSYESFRAEIIVYYSVSVGKAKYFYDCGWISLGDCESWRYLESFKINDICYNCTGHNDTRLLENESVYIHSDEWYDEIRFQKTFYTTLSAKENKDLKIFLPDELRFGVDNKYTSSLREPEIIDITYNEL